MHLLGQPFSVNLCTVDKMGSHCVSAATSVRQLHMKTEMDMTSILRLSWIFVSVPEGK